MDLITSTFILLLAVDLLTIPVEPAKILMIPISVNSHHVFFGQLAVGLVKEGHQVTIVATAASKLPANLESEGVSVYRYEGDKEQYASSDLVSNYMIQIALSNNTHESFNLETKLWDILAEHGTIDCELLHNDTILFNMIRKEKFDFAILDGANPSCYYALAHKLGIPYGTFAIQTSYMFINYRCPHLSSQYPNLYLRSNNKMDFYTRLMNTFLDVTELVAITSLLNDQNTPVIKRIIPNEPDISTHDLLAKSKLWLILGDPALSYPYSMMPNMVNIPDIMFREPKPLPKDMATLIDQQDQGVILVSFGSMMAAMPKEQSSIIFEGLGQVKQLVILKKAGYIPENVSNNIKLLDWLPQNDLLAHKNVKLFISHCGLNSVIEALHHSTPILAIPFALDQPYNAFLVQDKRIGKQLKLGNFTSKELASTIQEMLSTETFSDNAKKLSSILRDRPISAAARASHMINHVIKYGDDHLRTKAFNLNVLQFYMLDIYLFFTLCLVVLSIVCILIFRLVYRSICYVLSFTFRRFKDKKE